MPRIRAGSIAEHKTLTRSQILQAALDLFANHGYEKVSFALVAEKCDLGRTTLYDYFTDKHDMLASLVEEFLPRIIGEMVGRAPDYPPSARLRFLASTMLEFVVHDPALGHLLHRETPKLPRPVHQRVAAAHGTLSEELAAVYRSGAEQGEFKPLPGPLAEMFLYNLIMSAARTLIDSDQPQRDLPLVVRAVTDLLLTGLAADPDAPPPARSSAEPAAEGGG